MATDEEINQLIQHAEQLKEIQKKVNEWKELVGKDVLVVNRFDHHEMIAIPNKIVHIRMANVLRMSPRNYAYLRFVTSSGEYWFEWVNLDMYKVIDVLN